MFLLSMRFYYMLALLLVTGSSPLLAVVPEVHLCYMSRAGTWPLWTGSTTFDRSEPYWGLSLSNRRLRCILSPFVLLAPLVDLALLFPSVPATVFIGSVSDLPIVLLGPLFLVGTIPTSPWYYLNDSVHLPIFTHQAPALAPALPQKSTSFSSGSSSNGSYVGYGSVTSGSASDASSDDDLVNRHFAGIFPPL
ncbi:hypothetical protein PIB30_038981 [Stylosanthes scabra]|uniref:Uncharacterized protein n=1 Tax=Stylosanthes scabra TaxID=79078 RepID=A0ABU6XC97_9FABA|nr:hypothetical protein [Stylosanthes scabra]